jgi:F-type H+-transporting ATPase subunit a
MNILEHLEQKTLLPLHFFGIDLTVTNGVITVWLATLLVFLFFYLTSRRLKTIPGKAQNLAEILVLFLRDEVGGQIERDREKWLPFLVAIFSFILANNLLALIPGIASSTGNINTTAALALIVFVVVQATGITKHGVFGHLKSLAPEGVPFLLLPLMVPIELIGQLARPFSLAIRLFANMFAGHAVLLTIISLLFIFKNYFILPLPLAGEVIILAFEIFISLIQAFIFTYLTGLYIAIAQEGH